MRRPYVEEDVRIRPSEDEVAALVNAGFAEFADLQPAREAKKRKHEDDMAELEADFGARKKQKQDEFARQVFLTDQWRARTREALAEKNAIADHAELLQTRLDEADADNESLVGRLNSVTARFTAAIAENSRLRAQNSRLEATVSQYVAPGMEADRHNADSHLPEVEVEAVNAAAEDSINEMDDIFADLEGSTGA
jgi:chromosome segregation ATPase